MHRAMRMDFSWDRSAQAYSSLYEQLCVEEVINRGAMMYVLGIVLAGGRGQVLSFDAPHRAKPAVPFGGHK